MGGAIASYYTLTNTPKVESLGLISAMGRPDPYQQEFKDHLAIGQNPLIVTKSWDIYNVIDYTTDKPAWRFFVPLVAPALNRRALEKTILYEKIFRQIDGYVIPEKAFANLRIPVYIVWGDSDLVLRSSAADEFEELLSEAEVTKLPLLPKTGHLVILERAGEMAHSYLQFLESIE